MTPPPTESGVPQGLADALGEDVPTDLESDLESDRETVFEPMLAEIRAGIARDRGPRAWLRSRPTAHRLALALGAIGLVVGSDAAVAWAEGGSVFPVWWMVVHLVVLGGLVGAALVVALRPLHRPPLSSTVKGSLVLGALAAPIALALAPAALFPSLAATSTVGAAPGCFGFGAALAVPIIVLMRLLDRGAADTSILLAGAAAGVTANVLLHNHCAAADPSHLLLGHAAIAWLYVGGSALALRVVRHRAV